MDRSLYPEGVEVHQVDLERTESTKSFHITNRHVSSSVTGVESGGIVTVNTTNNTLVDITACIGYSPNDEYVEAEAQTALQLADYSSGVINYVIAIYTETNEDLKPHETNGESYPTSANRNSRIRVLSEAEYNALPDSDENLNNDAKDRALVLAKITAHGTGVGLTVSDISLPTIFGNAITAVNITGTILGAAIYNVDRTTPTGSGYLQYNTTTKNMYWQSPGTASYGSPVTIIGSGLVTLYGSSGKTLTLSIIYPSLPVVGTLVNTVNISNIYSQFVNRHTASDLMHRSFVGGGTPTTKNPHGMTLEDLGASAGIVEVHQDLFHSNGILRISSPTLFTTIVNTGDTPDSLDVTGPISGDTWYLNGLAYSVLSGTNVPFSDVIGINNQSLWDIYVIESSSATSILSKKERIRYVNATPLLRDVVQLMDLDESVGPGAGIIKFTYASKLLQYQAPGDSYGLGLVVPSGGAATDGYRIRLYSQNSVNWIDLYVADQSNTDWTAISTDQTENITIYARPSAFELEQRIKIATVMYSGAATGFVGCGYQNVQQNPNIITNNRPFGTLGYDDLSDNTGRWKSISNNKVNSEASELAITYNGFVGVGTDASPEHQLHVISSHERPVGARFCSNTITQRGTVLTQRSKGSKTLPVVVDNGTTIGGLSMGGFDGDKWTLGYNGGAEILAITEELWTSTNHGTRVSIFNTPSGSSTAIERLRLTSSGDVIIGTTMSAIAKLSVWNLNYRALNTGSYYSITNASEMYGQVVGTEYSVADTGFKQGLRVNTQSSNTSGLLSSLAGIVSLVQIGGDTTDTQSFWSRIDVASGKTATTATHLKISSNITGGVITNHYGIMADIRYGSAQNWGLYISGSGGGGAGPVIQNYVQGATNTFANPVNGYREVVIDNTQQPLKVYQNISGSESGIFRLNTNGSNSSVTMEIGDWVTPHASIACMTVWMRAYASNAYTIAAGAPVWAIIGNDVGSPLALAISDSGNVLGITIDDMPAGSWGRIAVSGICTVHCGSSGGLTAGNYVLADTAAQFRCYGSATPANAAYKIGTWMENGANGDYRAIVLK